MSQICEVFDGGKSACKNILMSLTRAAYSQAKASRTRPTDAAKQLFTSQEFEWFSKTAYNLALKYCTDMAPVNLVKLLNTCIEVNLHLSDVAIPDYPQFIKLLEETQESDTKDDLSLRFVFCEFLLACTHTTIARAEDRIEVWVRIVVTLVHPRSSH